MKQLRSVNEIGNDLNVILRMDTDLPMDNGFILDNSRLVKSLNTIKLLLERNNKIVIIGHLGRPEGKADDSLSLKPVFDELRNLLFENSIDASSIFINDIKDSKQIETALDLNQIVMAENLRFYPEEEAGQTALFETLKKYCTAYINDAFAVAHRKSASIILFREMQAYYGLSFVEETEKIGKAIESEERPITVILGGAKKDKLNYLDALSKTASGVLIGGKLPDLMDKSNIPQNALVATFSQNGFDISEESIEQFKKIISMSKTIIWAGAMGWYESFDNRKGTEAVANAIALNTNAYKVIAGGDTGASIINLGLKDKVDFICSGGGVLLEYLTKKALPAWE
jgi:phosphoglycerate kinase